MMLFGSLVRRGLGGRRLGSSSSRNSRRSSGTRRVLCLSSAKSQQPGRSQDKNQRFIQHENSRGSKSNTGWAQPACCTPPFAARAASYLSNTEYAARTLNSSLIKLGLAHVRPITDSQLSSKFCAGGDKNQQGLGFLDIGVRTKHGKAPIRRRDSYDARKPLTGATLVDWTRADTAKNTTTANHCASGCYARTQGGVYIHPRALRGRYGCQPRKEV